MCQSLIKLPEDPLIWQGDLTYVLYFISKGTCRAECTDFANQKHQIGEIDQGGIFGEISHLLKCRRTASVKCVDYVSLLGIPRVEGYQFRSLWPLLKK